MNTLTVEALIENEIKSVVLMEQTLKLLVIDDDEIDRMTVKRGLIKAGIDLQLTEAENCDEAIAALQTEHFDCVFLDYRLPDQDGLTLLKQIRNMGIDVPIIFLTGQGDEEIAVKIMKAGASDYLVKSKITPDILSRLLRNAIRVYQAEVEVREAHKRLRETNKLLIEQNQELARQKQQIQRQNYKLKQLSELKSQFLANISHELRTPMNAIIGFSQLLLRQYPDPLSGQQHTIVQRIFNNSQNLLNMLNEVLDFSKIEAGHLQLSTRQFDLAMLTQVTVEELRSLTMGKNLWLKTEIDLENPYIINDENYVKRIITNLISNAIKFTDQGGVTVKLQSGNSDTVEIVVVDTGCGIPEDHLETIFEAFRQVDQTLTRKYPGTGLGLAITQSIVKMMQGKIRVKSQLDQGSTFTVSIPRCVSQAKFTVI